MKPLLKKKVTLEIDGTPRSIGFRKEGNKHLFSDTFGRSSALKKEHLATLDKVLEQSTYVDSSKGLSHERKDNIRKFHYFKGEIDGKTVYLNVAELAGTDSKGKVKVKYFLYSITDRIRK